MKKLLFALVLLLAFPICVSAGSKLPITYISPDLDKLTIYKDITYQIDVDESQYKWKSSDYAVVFVAGNQFHGIQSGTATVTGTPKDPDKKKIKLRVTVPDFTYSVKDIVITSEEGAIFEYTYNRLRGSIDDIKATGNVFKFEKLKTDRLEKPNQILLKPIMPGKGKLIFKFSNGTQFTLNVTVEDSAASTPTPKPTNTPVPSYSVSSVNEAIESVASSVYKEHLKSAKYVADGEYVFIDYKTPRGQTPDDIRSKSYELALKLLIALQDLKSSGEIGFKEICFRTHADTIDNYGILEEYEVLSFWVSSDSFDATNFSSVSISEFLSLLSDSYEHDIMTNTPSPDSSENAESPTIYVGRAKRFVNIRSSPDANSKKVGHLNEGEKVKIVALNYSPKWHQIVFDNQLCYVSANYIELDK